MRVDQAVQATLGHRADFGHGDCQHVRRQCHGLSVGVGLGHHAVMVWRAEYQRVVGGAVEFGLDLARGVFHLVAGCTVDLWDRTDAQGVLGANALAAGDHFTAIEQRAQVDADVLHAWVRF